MHLALPDGFGALDIERVNGASVLILSPELGVEVTANLDDQGTALQAFQDAASAVIEHAFSELQGSDDEGVQQFVLAHGGLGTPRRSEPTFPYVQAARHELKRSWNEISTLTQSQ